MLVCQTGSIRAIIISYPVSESLLWGKLWLFEVRQRNEKNSYEEFRYFFFGEFFSGIIFREQRSIIRITSAVVRGELSKVIRGHSEVTREHYHHRQHHHHMYIPYFCFALFELVQELFSPEINKSFRVISRSFLGQLKVIWKVHTFCIINGDALFLLTSSSRATNPPSSIVNWIYFPFDSSLCVRDANAHVAHVCASIQ